MNVLVFNKGYVKQHVTCLHEINILDRKECKQDFLAENREEEFAFPPQVTFGLIFRIGRKRKRLCIHWAHFLPRTCSFLTRATSSRVRNLFTWNKHTWHESVRARFFSQKIGKNFKNETVKNTFISRQFTWIVVVPYSWIFVSGAFRHAIKTAIELKNSSIEFNLMWVFLLI